MEIGKAASGLVCTEFDVVSSDRPLDISATALSAIQKLMRGELACIALGQSPSPDFDISIGELDYAICEEISRDGTVAEAGQTEGLRQEGSILPWLKAMFIYEVSSKLLIVHSPDMVHFKARGGLGLESLTSVFIVNLFAKEGLFGYWTSRVNLKGGLKSGLGVLVWKGRVALVH